MTYAQARDRVLQLIGQYTMAGAPVALSYNNQADYVAKLPGLLNDALEYLFTAFRRVRATAELSSLARVKFGPHTAYVLPEDFWQMSGAGMVTFDGAGKVVRFHRYHLVEERMFVPDAPPPEPLIVEYFRRPRMLGSAPKDSDRLDGPSEVQTAALYYAAAHLVMEDSPYAYAALYGEFETRAALLRETPHGEWEQVENVYGGGVGDGT